MRRISRAFFTGLAAILPIVITVYLIVWSASLAEEVFGGCIRRVSPEFYRPGMGVAVGFVLTLALGLALEAWMVRKFFGIGEWLLHRMPIVNTVYGSARDLIRYFSDPDRKGFTQVVLVTMSESGFRQVGFITREDFRGCPKEMAGGQDQRHGPHGRHVQDRQQHGQNRQDKQDPQDGPDGQNTVAVFLPNSFETGGVTLLVPRAAVQAIDMPFHDALRFAITAGLSIGSK